MPGPPPKRESQRRRANTPAAGVPVSVPAGEVVVPDPDPDWHPVAEMMWAALRRSGQSVFYASGDWAAAYAMCESMSREYAPQPFRIQKGDEVVFEMVDLPPKAASLAAWSKMWASLLITEGDRRRAGLELEREPERVDEEGGADVSHIDDVRLRLAGS